MLDNDPMNNSVAKLNELLNKQQIKPEFTLLDERVGLGNEHIFTMKVIRPIYFIFYYLILLLFKYLLLK